ncbi:MAG: hypothetical protein MUD14_07135 [Hydrococcus sp. Prado102]|nr:hypothetical protein [Hydrococcus sp. Prado102]
MSHCLILGMGNGEWGMGKSKVESRKSKVVGVARLKVESIRTWGTREKFTDVRPFPLHAPNFHNS